MKSLFFFISLIPVMAFASAKTISLSLSNFTDSSDSRMCTYLTDLDLGSENSIVPFQLMVELPDGSFALQQTPHVLRYDKKSGHFYAKVGAARTVARGQACPSTAQLILIK